ncbi:MAG: hypothetical protein IMZ64_09350 [Bacteroidetes bacterium]|nr:hypothetical protein [Bacteroidota bacterium]
MNKQVFDELLSELQQLIERGKYNDSRGKLDSLTKFADWSDDPGLGVDLLFFCNKIGQNVKRFQNNKYIPNPSEANNDEEIDFYIHCDDFNDMAEMFSVSAGALNIAEELIERYHAMFIKLTKIMESEEMFNLID